MYSLLPLATGAGSAARGLTRDCRLRAQENEELVVQLYERAAVKKIVRAARAVQREIKAGKPKDAAFNACLIDLVRASEVRSASIALVALRKRPHSRGTD